MIDEMSRTEVDVELGEGTIDKGIETIEESWYVGQNRQRSCGWTCRDHTCQATQLLLLSDDCRTSHSRTGCRWTFPPLSATCWACRVLERYPTTCHGRESFQSSTLLLGRAHRTPRTIKTKNARLASWRHQRIVKQNVLLVHQIT